MRIEVGGKRWIVEERDLPETAGSERFCDIAFRNEEVDDELVQIRWVIKPRRMTVGVAEALFELAGERLWRNPRSGAVHRIHLEPRSLDSDSPDAASLPDPIVVFRSETGRFETDYDLEVPLGLASDEELEDVLERARRGGGPAPVTD